MSRSALENVRAHLRFVSRIGHSHAVSMCAWPIALTRCASGSARRRERGRELGARRAAAEPATSSRSIGRARGFERVDAPRPPRGAVVRQLRRASLREHEHVEVQRLDVAVRRPRARPGPAGRSAGRRRRA